MENKVRRKVMIIVLSIVLFLGIATTLSLYHFLGISKCVGDTKYKITINEVHTKYNDIDIFGKTIVPVDESKTTFPTIIYCHGAESDYKADMTTIKSLAKSGFAIYTFDFYGWTTRTKGPIEGAWFKGHARGVDDVYENKVIDQTKELDAVIENVKTFSFVDKDNIFLLGSSMGGVTVATCAVNHSDDIKAIILQYPAIYLNPNSYNSQSDYCVNNYKNDVLILQGTNDKIVDISLVEELHNYYNQDYSNKSSLIIYEGEPHVFTGKYKVQAAKDIYKFLMKQIGGSNNV